MAAISSPPVPPGDVVRVLPTLADRAFARGLAGLDDRELLGMVRSLAGGSGSRAAACELLVSRHRNLVYSCVRRYRGGTEPAEDLMQVGYVGLMKAISRFDPAGRHQPGRLRTGMHQRRDQAALPGQVLAGARQPLRARSGLAGSQSNQPADPGPGPGADPVRDGQAPGGQR